MTQGIVYLLDDEPAMLELLSDMAEMSGQRTQSYSRASHFFDQVTSFAPRSILVLDLNMPEMDGIEVMRRLAQMDNSPALILISGHDIGVLHAAEKLGRAHSLEIIASLNKPLKLDKFRQVLEQYVSGFSGQQKMYSQALERQLTEEELRRAIRNDHLALHYQPQFEIATGKLIGVEALVRWQHPELGMIYPDRFIPLAEQSGLMGEITHWVIGEVVQQEQLLHCMEVPVVVSVNISADDITSLTLPEYLAELLVENRLDPTRLTLEVTESALMGELVTSLDILTRLRLKGIRLSIDDFGTGYSSLSQLHRVPFTELKIDRSFVANIIEDSEAHAIVKTCILLGHELKMKVVAEGVETKAQLEQLKEMKCDIAQGYLFSRPLPAKELIGMYGLKSV